MRLNPLAVVLALLHAYIGIRLLAPLDTAWQVAGGTLLLALYVLLPKGFYSRKRSASAVMLSWLATGFFSSLLVLTLIREFALLFGAPAGLSAIATFVAAPIVTAIGFVMATMRPRVVDVDVPIEGLPEALENFTIVQVTDVHVGPTIKRGFVERVVERVNRLEADVVAITGDVVDGSVEQLSEHLEPMARLRARHGTFMVTGNHEYYSGAHAWIREFRRLGANVLLNDHAVVEHEGHVVAIAGVTDFSAHHFDPSHRSDPMRAISGAPEGAVKVLLAHQPRSLHEARRAGYHLQISGHTHGGQFWPWNFFVRLQQPFTAGLRKADRMWVYISSGTGYWGPPMRFGVPSEITRIRLVHEARRPSRRRARLPWSFRAQECSTST
jgi:predicted MPP superfamily phosphohydrolase